MPWVRFADDYLGNVKLVGLSPMARLLDMCGIIYSARELRDGHLGVPDVQAIAALIHLKKWEPAARELVAERRWTAESGGWAIHDYLDYQPSREKVLGERAAAVERKRQAAAKRTNGVHEDSGRNPGEVRPDSGSPVPGPGINSRPPARQAGRTAGAPAREPTDFQPLGELLHADLPDEVLERLGRAPIGQPAKPASPSIPSQETNGNAVG